MEKRRKIAYTIQFFVPFILLLMLFGLFKNLKTISEGFEYIDLNNWEYSLDEFFSPEKTFKLEKKDFQALYKFVPDRNGYIYLRSNFNVPQGLLNDDLGYYLGEISIAADVFMNSEYFATVGTMPPKEFSPGTSSHALKIPSDVINYEGENQLVLKLWVNYEGAISSENYITNYSNALIWSKKTSFFLSKVNLGFAFSSFYVGLFFFFFYITRRKHTEHLIFSLLCFCSSGYLFPYFVSELIWIPNSFMSYLSFSKQFLAFFAFSTMYLATSFMYVFLKVVPQKKVLIGRISILVFCIIFAYLMPSYVLFRKVLLYLYMLMVLQMLPGIWHVFRKFIKKDKNAFILVGGFLPVLLTVFIDFILRACMKNYNYPFFTVWGWQGTLLCFIQILSIRYNKIYANFEYLSTKLKTEVRKRTKKLVEKQKMAQRDMDLAINVQKSSLPAGDVQFQGWEMAVYFMPFSGISGDVYDFFSADDILGGVGLFDVSGHGLPAGLLAMMSKSIISREFQGTLKGSKSLSQVMTSINEEIIVTKGNVENYLTGLLTKFGDATKEGPCPCQIISAGHPPAILYKKATSSTEFIMPSENDCHYGMIGMPGLNFSYPTMDFFMDDEDVLLLYTDGLTEYSNAFDVDFGKERLAKSLKHAADKSAEDILKNILYDVEVFADNVAQNDDITIIVLKRKKDADYIQEL